jgi:hypothetical protein
MRADDTQEEKHAMRDAGDLSRQWESVLCSKRAI